jgi:ribosomal protein S12 methylthiotransferase
VARDRLVGTRQRVLVDAPGEARSWREAPEIDGVVHVDASLAVGDIVDVDITESLGVDLVGTAVGAPDAWKRRAP